MSVASDLAALVVAAERDGAALVVAAERDGAAAVPVERIRALADVADALRILAALADVDARLRARPGLTVRSACRGAARVAGLSESTVRNWFVARNAGQKAVPLPSHGASDRYPDGEV